MVLSQLFFAGSLAGLAVAQNSTVVSTAPVNRTTTTSPTSLSAQLTTSLLLPTIAREYPGQVVASVIAANQNWTAYVLDCLPFAYENLNHTRCDLAQLVTLTEGISTFIYTSPPPSDAGTSLLPPPPPPTAAASTGPPPSESSMDMLPQVSCELFGGTRASKAICTGHSIISGLGNVGSTTTLASTQLTYINVTVTAGAEVISSAMAGATTTSILHGAAPPLNTAAARLAALGVAGMLLF